VNSDQTAGELELAELQAANWEAIKHHPQSAQLLSQFRDIYMLRMLEHLCGDALPAIKLAYERVVDELLGQAGKQMCKVQLLRPPPMANGRYTPPKGARLRRPTRQT
jgi:hypothetical protein